MSKENKTTYLWRIITSRNGEDSSIQRTEHFVVATEIDQLWDYLENDRLDEGVDIVGINREVPIIKDLTQK